MILYPIAETARSVSAIFTFIEDMTGQPISVCHTLPVADAYAMAYPAQIEKIADLYTLYTKS